MGEKKVQGLKRHLLVDTLGFRVLGTTTPGNASERRVGVRLLAALKASAPRATCVVADQGYTGAMMRDAASANGLDLRLTKRPSGREGEAFVLMPKRWIIERTFAWLSRCRRLDRSRERRPYVHGAFITVAFIRLLAKRLLCTDRL
jgi:transposase